jgi:very-short-patch-repair endonuclease
MRRTISKYNYSGENIMKCEECGKEHDGSYGSGRFCSKHCRSVYSAKTNHNKKSNRLWICVWCNKQFKTRREMFEHSRNEHKKNSQYSWNKGLTKETCSLVAKGGQTYHQRCQSGEIEIWCKGKNLSEETKQKISESMKKAHAENRAHNIGECRWNNEPSWPEKWFMNVIQNEFEDKQYVHEFPFHKFSLDFAWPHKKKCIEIDGDQHQRFEDYIERDKRKNAMLIENEWKYLRLVWKDVYDNPKHFIKLAKQFIDG